MNHQREQLEVTSSNNKTQNDKNKATDMAAKSNLAVHTMLLQNNLLNDVPEVLHLMPSLRVVQMHGNPCFKSLAVERFIESLNHKPKESNPRVLQKSNTSTPTRILKVKNVSLDQCINGELNFNFCM